MQNADGQVLIRAELDTASVTDGIAKMKTALEELKTYAGRQFSLIRSQAQKEGNSSVSWIPGLASRLINALTLGINGGGTRIGNALRGVLVSAMSAGSEYSSRFSGIGADVISGIIRGIQGTASSLWNTLRAVASNMLSTLKHALGIQSPSRVMREEIGRQICAGIAGGMLDCREQISSAAQTLANDAIGTLHGSGTVQLSAAGVLLRGTAVPSSVGAAKSTAYAAAGAWGAAERTGTAVGGNTFIFQKPVETPYRHAQAIRETMEEMLYGT